MADYKPKENYPGFDKDLDMEGVEIKDVAEPTTDDSVATKKYVDDTVAAAEIAVTEQALAATLADYALIADYTTTEDLAANYASVALVDSLQKVQITSLTAAQVKALNATPIMIVPKAGAGTAVVLDRVLFRYNYAGAAFTNGSALSAIYQGGSTNLLTGTLAASFLTGPTDVVTSDAVLAAVGTQLAVPQDTNILLKAAAAEFAGDATGTLDVVCWYREVGADISQL